MTKIVRWEEIPDLDLYLDQVLLYVNKETTLGTSLSEKNLTASMVNNYVKHNYIPKPIKKKYNRAQVARLIVLTICKPVFPIPDIAQTIEHLREESDAASLYNAFVDCYCQTKAEASPLIQSACQTIRSYHATLALAHSS